MIRSKSFVSDLSSQMVEEFVLSKTHYINIVIAYFFIEYHFIFGNLSCIHDVQMVQFNFIEYHVIFGNLCCIYDVQFNGIKVPRITLSFKTFHSLFSLFYSLQFTLPGGQNSSELLVKDNRTFDLSII